MVCRLHCTIETETSYKTSANTIECSILCERLIGVFGVWIFVGLFSEHWSYIISFEFITNTTFIILPSQLAMSTIVKNIVFLELLYAVV